MSTKICPSCDAEVPASATRCKHCFYEFGGEGTKKKSGVMPFLIALAAMVSIGAGVMWYVLNHQAVKKNVVIDEETHSIVWTKVSAKGVETDRVIFDDVEKVEFVIGGSTSTYEVAVITDDGSRKMLRESSDTSLKGYAEHIAHVMEKPFEEVKKVQGFGELDKK